MASYSTILVVVALAMVMILSANALQCYQCGQFNDGVGSITPCLNYSANLAHLHLKECSRKSDKFCVVSNKKDLFLFYTIGKDLISFSFSIRFFNWKNKRIVSDCDN